jgi:DNA-damage-inducible protein J
MLTFLQKTAIMFLEVEVYIMSKVSTNISLDSELKKASQELYADLGMDLSTAVTIFLKQSLRVQGIPFTVTRENPNAETVAAMNEYYAMKEHPENYKRYSSFKEAMSEALANA